MSYLYVKYIHVGAVTISVSGFLLRYLLSLSGDGWRRFAVLRIGPHVVDTVLLGSAIWLSAVSRQYPFVHGWLTAKVIALVVYIVAGSVALKYGRTERTRAGAFVISVIAVFFLVGAATRKSAWGWF